MSRRRVLALLALVTACGAPGPTAAEQAVRDYVALRNAGDLHGLLAKSCGGLYSSTDHLLALTLQQRREIATSMRAHPVDVESVALNPAGDHVFTGTTTGSAQTADGRRSASQRVEVRQFRDGSRVCVLQP